MDIPKSDGTMWFTPPVARIQDHVHDLIDAEIDRQDEIHPQGYAADRDGVRFGLCTVEDELREAVQAWRDERRVDGWMQVEEELTQALAVGARLLRSLILARSDALSTTRAEEEPIGAPVEPLGTCFIHGDYWTEDCRECGR